MPDSKTQNEIDTPQGVLIVHGINLDLRHEFKAACALEKRSMKDVIIELMKQYIASCGS